MEGVRHFMKLTGNLKKQVETSATKDEAREAIRNAGMELGDDEMDQVAGAGYFIGALGTRGPKIDQTASRRSQGKK